MTRNILAEGQKLGNRTTIIVDEYDTWTAAIDVVEHGKTTMRDESRSSRTDSAGWDSLADGRGRTFADFLKMARQGWPEGRAKIDEMARQMDVNIAGRIANEYLEEGMTGPIVDVQAAVIGLPEQFLRIEDSQEDAKRGPNGSVVKIVVNVSAGCGVSGEALYRRAAALGAVAMVLERTGRAVDITVCDAMTFHADRSKRGEARIHVKRSTEYVDPDLLAFAIAHPSVLRRVFFGIEECWPEDLRYAIGIPGGYGGVDALLPMDADIVLGHGADNDDADFSTPERAEAWVLAMLAKLGVVMRPQ